MFLITIGIILCLITADGLEYTESRLSEPSVLRRLYSAVGYTLRPMVAVMVSLIMMLRRKEKYRASLYVVWLLPLIANAALSFISIFNGCVFSYSASNGYIRGKLGYVPFLISIFYVLFMVVVSVIGVSVRQKGEILVVVTIAVLCLGGSVIESLYKLEGTLNTSCAIGTVFYYLYLHVSVYSTDQLTGAYNRRIFYIDIDKLRKCSSVIVEIDLNHLKQINDTGGHSAGDHALITLVSCINKNSAPRCTLYRTGGDEFMILCRNMELPEAEQMMTRLKTAMESTGYTFAYGCTAYRPGDNIDDSCNEADEKMYKMKADMKALRE